MLTDSQLPALIFVPGIRPKPPAPEQQEQLRRCLNQALTVACGKEDEVAELVKGLHVVGWSRQFYGEHGDVQPDLPGVDRLLSGVDDPEQDSREATSVNRKINGLLYAIADRFPALTNIFSTRRMETRVEEIHRYFEDNDGKAAAARTMVAERLQSAWDKGQRTLVIGHSFGSVIAYDTLWELSRQQRSSGEVELFISMGSPLTMRYIRDRLKGTGLSGAERYPANIRRWINLAAIGEVTAQNRRLADCFAQMLQLNLTESIEDNLSLVNQFRGAEGLNVHKCYGYMASPLLGKILLDWFRSPA